MNIKEANEIIKEYENDPTSVTSFRSTYTMAKGYLECLEKAKVLEDELKDIKVFLEDNQDNPDYVLEMLYSVLRDMNKALSEWEKLR